MSCLRWEAPRSTVEAHVRGDGQYEQFRFSFWLKGEES